MFPHQAHSVIGSSYELRVDGGDPSLHWMLADTTTCLMPERPAALDHLHALNGRTKHPCAVWLMGKLQSLERPGTCSAKGWDFASSLKLVFTAALGHAHPLDRHAGRRANEESKAARLAGAGNVVLSGN